MEALLLGGSTATLSEGRVTQFGPTSRVYRDPRRIEAARVFSDPPLDELTIVKQDGRVKGVEALSGLARRRISAGIPRRRRQALDRRPPARLSFSGTVAVTELSGSESFVHVDVGVGIWVCLVEGVHDWAPGQTVNVNVDPTRVFAFDAKGARVRQPHAAEVVA